MPFATHAHTVSIESLRAVQWRVAMLSASSSLLAGGVALGGALCLTAFAPWAERRLRNAIRKTE